jgi:hypothetical protein
MDILSEARRITKTYVRQFVTGEEARRITDAYPDLSSPQADGDSSPLRMTLAEPTTQTVWLLWRNEIVCGVFGSEATGYRELMEMQAVMGGTWDRVDDFARVFVSRSGTTLRMEPREVHR